MTVMHENMLYSDCSTIKGVVVIISKYGRRVVVP